MVQKTVKSIEDLKQIFDKQDRLYLYGAGSVGQKLISVLDEITCLNKVQAILVSRIEKKKSVGNIPIVQYKKSIIKGNEIILIATTAHSKEILDNLEKDGIKNTMVLAENFENVLDTFVNEQRIKRIYATKNRWLKEFQDKQEKSDYDIAFLTPPYWDMYAPFSAVPCLKAKLMQEGYSVYQMDIGIICMHYAIKKYGNDVAEQFLCSKCYDDLICCYEKNPYTSYKQYVDDMDFLQGESVDVKSIKARYKTMNFVQKCVVDNFYQRIYSMGISDIDFDSCVSIADNVEKYNQDFIWDIFEEESVRKLFTTLPGVIGMSITSPCQFLAGCLIAQYIHQINPDTKIIFGGSCADLFVNSEYPKKYDIYEYFDFVLIGEGETAITKTLQFIKGEIAISEIPNLAVIDKNNQVNLNQLMVEEVLELPLPDYDDLNLELYLSPELILPYQSSRGCHYGYCAFCNHDEKYRHNYRTKHMKQVVEDLVALSKKYQAKCFQFVDEAIRPDCFRLLVDEMERNPEFTEIRWFYYSRVSREYDKNILEKAYRNGCQMVMFGIETFNQRLLNFIKKGINAETSKYCLKLFKQCKIKTYAWLMDNLPSETIEEAKADLEEVKQMKEYIDAFSVGPFMLVKNTDMYKNPESYNIIERNDKDPIRFQSHNNGQAINKEEMLRFHTEEYGKHQLDTFLFGNRYTLFFD